MQIMGTCTPFPSLTITSLTLTSAKGNLVFMGSGTFATVPVSVSVTSRKPPASAGRNASSTYDIQVTARNVNIAPMVTAAAASLNVRLTDAITAFIAPMAVDSVTISYVNKKLSLSAVPKSDATPQFATVAQVAGLGRVDVLVTLNSAKGLTIAASKALTFTPPSPFYGPSTAIFAAGANSADRKLFITASINTAIQIPGVSDPASFSATIGFRWSLAKGASKVPDVALSGTSLEPISFDAFPAIQLTTLDVATEFKFIGTALEVESLWLNGSALIFGATMTVEVLMDKTGDVPKAAVRGALDRLDVQAILRGIGSTVDLGAFNPQLSNLSIAYATEDIPDLDFHAGCITEAIITIFGVSTSVLYEVTVEGTHINVMFDAEKFSEVRPSNAHRGRGMHCLCRLRPGCR
jgi:hypothetical protein